MVLLSAGCLVPPPDDLGGDEEAVEQAAAALARAGGAPRASTDAGASALEGLPRWHAYLTGTDALAHDDPRTIDGFGAVVAVREGDEDDRSKWIQLNLTTHWMMGDRYFDELRQARHLTGTDLLTIASDLLQNGSHLPPPPGSKNKPRSPADLEGDSSPYNPFPGFLGDDHTGGPVAGRGGHSGTPGQPPPGKRAPSAKPPVIRPSAPPAPPTPAQEAGLRAYLNGVRRGDPEPRPFPGEAHYRPAPDEREETFKCEGGVFHGYKHACVDFQPMPNGVKWGEKLSAWSGRYFDPKNVAMNREDWTTLCKLSTIVVSLTGCLAVIGSCGLSESMTFGTVTIPCYWLVGTICGGHSAGQALLSDRCGILAGAR
jgi:hypothetical protein